MTDHPSKKRRTEKSAVSSSTAATPPTMVTKSTIGKHPQRQAVAEVDSDDSSDDDDDDDDDDKEPSGDGGSGDEEDKEDESPGDKEKSLKKGKLSEEKLKKKVAAAVVEDEFDVSDASENENDEYDDPISDSDNDSENDNDSFSDSNNDSDSSLDYNNTTTNPSNKKRKRNNPTIFSTSLTKILSSTLSTKARSDPVLIRAGRKGTVKVADESRLEQKARRVLKEEKRKELEKGRVRDVVGAGAGGGVELARGLERERALRKVAQRGVVRLFNAVRAAQVKSEEAREEVRKKGVVGVGKRDEKVTEMSKQGFLDLIQSASAK